MRLGRILAVLVMVLGAKLAVAGVYSYQPSPKDLYDLEHKRAYRWGIQPDIANGEEIIAASLTFDNIRNWKWETNDLWITLIDDAALGVQKYTDHSASGNYFAGWGVLIEHYKNLPATPMDLTYEFTEAEVDVLNDYIDNNNFGLGFDPDCHFYNCGVTLYLETEAEHGGSSEPVPEPTTLVLGGLGMLLARRKRR